MRRYVRGVMSPQMYSNLCYDADKRRWIVTIEFEATALCMQQFEQLHDTIANEARKAFQWTRDQ